MSCGIQTNNLANSPQPIIEISWSARFSYFPLVFSTIITIMNTLIQLFSVSVFSQSPLQQPHQKDDTEDSSPRGNGTVWVWRVWNWSKQQWRCYQAHWLLTLQTVTGNCFETFIHFFSVSKKFFSDTVKSNSVIWWYVWPLKLIKGRGWGFILGVQCIQW